ncbi:MAG: hypothetical protein IPK60_03600 [Sandaracinaceae bacterium]|nr:hypothetical protein [Sandaracinaceae bacterium]
MTLSRKSMVVLFACISAVAGAGCVAATGRGLADTDKASGPGTSFQQGKADGQFEIRDEGPLPMGQTQRVDVTSVVHAYRVQSFGDTSLAFDLRGGSAVDAYIAVEGPLDGNGDSVGPGEGHVIAQNDDFAGTLDSHLDITLEEPGVYRVIAGTYETLRLLERARPSELTLEATCNANCTRPEISLQQLLTELRENGQLEPFVAMARQQIATLIPGATERAALNTTLDGVLASQNFEGLERFPMLPLRQFDAFRLALSGFNSAAPAPDRVVNGELSELLGTCASPDRANPPAVNAALSSVGNGHFPDLTLSACQAAHSATLAQILTSLSVGNGSSVTYQGQEITSPGALLRALMQNGHAVEVRNERSYANFLSMTYGELNVRWPGWLDTGVRLDSGESLVVPMGHSQETWHISGPDLEARVMFYLGTSGAAFFPQTSVRPAWTGLAAKDITSNEGSGVDEHAIAVADAAAAYLRRSRIERSTVAQGMPADGYGYVGVCNDSVAAIEYLVEGTITAYPLVRAAALDSAPYLNDGLDDVLRILPNDADVAVPTSDALTRILAMTPHPLDSDLIVDGTLRAQLVRARNMLNDGAR